MVSLQFLMQLSQLLYMTIINSQYRIKSLAKSIFVSNFCFSSTCVFTMTIFQWNYPDTKDTWVSGEAQSKQTNKTNFLRMQNVTNPAIRSNMLQKLYDLCYRIIMMMLFRFYQLLKKNKENYIQESSNSDARH